LSTKQELKDAIYKYGDLCMTYGERLVVSAEDIVPMREQWQKINAMIEELIPDDK
jgi:hypothetical protein